MRKATEPFTVKFQAFRVYTPMLHAEACRDELQEVLEGWILLRTAEHLSSSA